MKTKEENIRNKSLNKELDKTLTECPLCNNQFGKIGGISMSFNGLCHKCAKATWKVWDDFENYGGRF